MPFRSGCSSRPASTAWPAWVLRVAASGSSRNVIDFQAGSRTSAGSGLPVSAASRALAASSASSGWALIHRLVSTDARSTASTALGCLSRNSWRTTMFVITNLPSGHSDASSSSTLPPCATSRDAVGSGTHAPSTEPDLNASGVTLLSLRTTVTSPLPLCGSTFQP